MKTLSFLILSIVFLPLDVLATIPITVQGVVRDSGGDLVVAHAPVGGIRAAFYHATHCNGPVNGDASFTGCAPSGGAGSEVIDPFNILVGAFSVTVIPQVSTLANMATTNSGWYVKLKGEFSNGAPVGEFLIPVNSVPFANVAATAALAANTVASGNSIISAINSTASTDTKIDADRLDIDGGNINTGTIGGDTVVSTSGTITGSAIIAGSGSSTAAGVQVGSNSGTGVYSSAANKLDFTTNGTQKMSIDASGSVGIGQDTPAAKLDIADTTLSGSGALAGSLLNLAQTWNTTGAPTAIKLNVTDTASSASSLLMDLQVGGNSRFVVRKDGNIGIGVMNPSYKFELNGSLGMHTTTGTHSLYLAPSSSSWVLGNTSTGAIMTFNTVNILSMGQPTSWGGAPIIASERVAIKGSTSDSNTSSFKITNSINTSLFYVRNDGNIGVGTATPRETLEVAGTARANLFLANYGNSASTSYAIDLRRTEHGNEAQVGAGLGIRFTNRSPGGLWAPDAFINKVFQNDGTSVTTGYEFVVHNNQIRGSTTTAMTINGSNIGIGVGSPQEKLDVSGNIKVAKNSAQPYACDAIHDGVLALTSGYRHCVCNGSAAAWVFTSDGVTACTW